MLHLFSRLSDVLPLPLYGGDLLVGQDEDRDIRAAHEIGIGIVIDHE